MIWLVVILGFGVVLWWVLDNKFQSKRANRFWDDNPLAFLSGLFATIALIAIPITTVYNGATLAELQVFDEANMANYGMTVDETKALLSLEAFSNSLITGSLEKFEQSGYVSERIKEWRDVVNTRNTKVASMKFWDSNILFGIMFPDAVQDMHSLIIQD